MIPQSVLNAVRKKGRNIKFVTKNLTLFNRPNLLFFDEELETLNSDIEEML